MIKFSIPTFSLLFSLILASCSTPSTNDKQPDSTPLTAISQPTKPEQIEALIDSEYETAIIEADLPSPRKEMTGHIDKININVNYGSPSVKDRDIWGALVPFDKVWRTGANEATRFTTDQTILINGQELAAGTYGLFTLPSQDKWQLIFNKTAEQWGAYEYDESKDVLRVELTPESTEELSETIEFIIERNNVILLWENMKLPFMITPKL